jgi:glycosyltransferase involved in cell wall biosynthesis
MASGLPVVAVRASGIEEIVSDGVSGLLVPEDVGAFATAVDEILTDPHLRAKLAMGARDDAAAFGSMALAHRLIAAYQRAQGTPAWS